ncbi:hypothetical protein Dsin_022074 [Dipteronia sinensis]|uniref:Bulb-type lectin domain-containing protein n=1 Tax=Dipteronia sinensis TaxID=43782 RepID=A0AAE0A1U3_9ROSI|nr:hypothetical protein Dsin_022074 [Dipteronia sinensis]
MLKDNIQPLVLKDRMASSSSYTMSFLAFFFFFSLSLISIAKATVPPSETFKFVNEGEFGPYINEYDADYRTLSVFSSPFQLCFYNTTPNAYTLALRMGIQRTEPLYRWVWEANRGKPLLSNGNMVLHDSKGKFIWQSFDYPIDTLLMGQSLRVGGVTKLVSRKSAKENVDGAYSFLMEPKQLAMYQKGLLGWSKSCEAKKLTSCAAKDFHYYKVEGVDHYMSKYTRGSGPVKVDDCGKKCTSDCKCLGYFYNQDTSRCWIAYDLMTLTKVSNSTQMGFIKVPNKNGDC